MSRQLKLSATLSVMAMALFAAFGGQAMRSESALALPGHGAQASVPALPALHDLLPSLR